MLGAELSIKAGMCAVDARAGDFGYIEGIEETSLVVVDVIPGGSYAAVHGIVREGHVGLWRTCFG
jgi:hypothetical protein